MNMVAFDSKEFTRPQFFAPIGVGVELEDTSYKDTYVAAISEMCTSFGSPTKRKVLDSNTLERTFGLPNTITMLEDFLRRVTPSIKEMTVFFSMFSTTQVPKVMMYSRDRSPAETRTIEFLRYINPSFVELCAWKYLQENRPSGLLLLDHFQSKETNASQAIRAEAQEGRLFIYPHGDMCNPYISTADLLVKLVNARLDINYQRLSEEAIAESFRDVTFPLKIQFIGQPDLPDIVPWTRRMSDMSTAMVHPMYFIVLDSNLPPKRARHLFEDSPAMDHVINAAFDAEGAYKFFDMDTDRAIIQNGDVFITTASKSEEVVDFVSGVYDINVTKAKNLRS